jgi:polysaccharide export outer membrane protein
VTIFSTVDFQVPRGQQNKFVRLEGEFVAYGNYSVCGGKTFKQLVVQAGDFSPDAYLYGSEFAGRVPANVSC